jgi:hypothetical protein
MFPAGESNYSSLVEALEAAIEWWQTETWCRSVLIRRYVLNHAGRSGRLTTSALAHPSPGKSISLSAYEKWRYGAAKVTPNPRPG